MSNIIAIGGGGFLAEPRNFALEKYILDETGKARPNVLMIPTARGDDAEYVAKFHAAFGELGATTQHLPFFHRTPDIRALDARAGRDLRRRRQHEEHAGRVARLGIARDAQRGIRRRASSWAGRAPGAICWFEQGVTDSWADRLRPLECMGFLPGSCCPHYDGEVERRPAYHALVQSGDLKPGYAIEDAVAAHFRDGRLERVVSKKAGAKAYHVSVEAGAIRKRRST